jgi:predicted nucleic acid-binding protein
VSRRKEVVRRATRGVTFDTGVLIALERRKVAALALLRACQLSRARITLPTGVLAEWWRGTHAALLDVGMHETLTPQLALQAGRLLARTGKSNAVDATVIASAAQRRDVVVTSDPGDLRELAEGVAGVDVETIS